MSEHTKRRWKVHGTIYWGMYTVEVYPKPKSGDADDRAIKSLQVALDSHAKLLAAAKALTSQLDSEGALLDLGFAGNEAREQLREAIRDS